MNKREFIALLAARLRGRSRRPRSKQASCRLSASWFPTHGRPLPNGSMRFWFGCVNSVGLKGAR